MSLSVLHVSNQWGIGGTEKAAELFIRNHNSDYQVAGAALETGGERSEALESSGYDFYYPNDTSELTNVLQDRDVDLIHSHTANAETVSRAAEAADVPIVVRTDQFGAFFQPDAGHGIDFFFYPTTTVHLRTVLLEEIGIDGDWPKRMATLFNPLDVNDTGGVSDLREKYDIPADAPVVGKIGRPAPEKWGQLTVDAFERAASELPEARLFLVGVPEKIRKAIQNRGFEDQVVYAEPLPPEDVNRFYETIDVLAHTSAIGESYGYVIAEAMSNAVPVVVDSIPLRDNAQIELVNNAQTGYVANSATAYGDALARLLQDDEKREQFGRAARSRVHEFDVSTLVERLEGFYEQLAVEKGVLEETNQSVPSYESRRESFKSFSREYERRLDDEFGESDFLHDLERRSWRGITRLPTGRKTTYELLRKGFIFGNEYI